MDKINGALFLIAGILWILEAISPGMTSTWGPWIVAIAFVLIGALTLINAFKPATQSTPTV